MPFLMAYCADEFELLSQDSNQLSLDPLIGSDTIDQRLLLLHDYHPPCLLLTIIWCDTVVTYNFHEKNFYLNVNN